MKSFAFDKEFYISKSVKSFVKPQNLLEYSNNNPDVFHNSKKTNYGKAMGAVAVVGVVAGAAAIAEIVESK